MKKLALAAASGVAALALATTALAQGPTEKVRKLNLYSWPQAALPQSYQAAQLIAQQWRQLGLDVEVSPLQRQQQTQLIWFSRDKWDVTMWRMVGRPERSDPDEFLYNLFHSTTPRRATTSSATSIPSTTSSPRSSAPQLDREERRKTAFEMQKIIDRDQPQAFLVHPKYALAFNKAVFKEDTVVNQSGIGIRNIWTFLAIQPLGAQKDLIINSNEVINATNPLYIGGAVDSWVTDLIWDRLMRIGPDGMPQPWAAESVAWVDDKTDRREDARRHEVARRQAGDARGRDLLVRGAGRRQGADVQALRHRHRLDREDRRADPALHPEAAQRRPSSPPRSPRST